MCGDLLESVGVACGEFQVLGRVPDRELDDPSVKGFGPGKLSRGMADLAYQVGK